jgi:methyltransferase (TIGR00027 family)
MTQKIASENLLGSTAHWTAAVRDLETRRADRLFNDPWAAALAGEKGAGWLAQRSPESVIPIIIRTRYFDDFLSRITTEQGIRQIVLLAAGLDTRAFRLAWPQGTRLFELDQPEVLDHKEEILRSQDAHAACERRVIGKDLAEPWQDALAAGGFDPQQPSGWLLEGFLFYLPNATILRLLDEVTSLAVPGSWLGFDIINSTMLSSSWTQSWVDMQAQAGAPWIGTLDEPEDYLASLGWQAALTQAGQPDASYGRWVLPVLPVKMPDMPHNWFVTAFKD